MKSPFKDILSICVLALLIFGFVCLGRVISRGIRSIRVDQEDRMLLAFGHLTKEQRYDDAIRFLEKRPNLLEGSSNAFILRTELSDCYRIVGDYGKAEKVLWESYNNPLKFVPEEAKKGNANISTDEIVTMFRSSAARDLMHLYEQIGDTKREKECYLLMKSAEEEYRTLLSKVSEEFGTELADPFLVYRYDDFRYQYLDDRTGAMSGMKSFLDSLVSMGEKDKLGLEGRCYSTLLRWQKDNGRLLDYYATLYDYVDLALHPFSYKALSGGFGDLSDMCYEVGDYENAEKFIRLYDEWLTDNYHKSDLEYQRNRYRFFKFYERDGKWRKLEKELTENCRVLREKIEENFLTMSSSQREIFATILQGPFEYAKGLMLRHPSKTLAKLCLENEIFEKGLLLRATNAMRNAVAASKDSSIEAKYKQLVELKQELTEREALNESGIPSLEKKIEALDKELCMNLGIERENTHTIKEVSNSLGTSVLVSYGETIFSDRSHLYALVLSPEADTISVINLGVREKIDTILSKDISDIYSDEELARFIWSPVEQVIGNHDVYYTCSGVFSQVALPALCLDSKTEKHLCDSRRLSLISSPARLATADKTRADSKIVSLWGGIDYGASTSISDANTTTRGIERGRELEQLPTSRYEVTRINSMISRTDGYNSLLFTGDDATEDSFKNRSGKADEILHISTHGFFDDSISAVENPLFNSGLMFASANGIWCQTDSIGFNSLNGNDGILRGSEIELLDLSGCQLAVLSACETGLGFHETSEGVYGLQRAFKLAGVEKIVMSLWNVNDFATSELMIRFYTYFLETGDAQSSLDNACREIRAISSDPKSWGAFVLLD